MTLTPRQIDAYLEFSNKLDHLEHGDSKEIEKTLKEISG